MEDLCLICERSEFLPGDSIAVSVFAPNLKDEQVCLEFLPDSIELRQSNQGSGGLDLKNKHFLKLNQMFLAKNSSVGNTLLY